MNVKLPLGSFHTQFDVIRRALHILSLIQHSSGERWNMTTLADALSRVSGESEPLSNKQINSCITWLKEAGFPVVVQKGSTHIYLEKEIDPNLLLDILTLYFPLAIDPVGIHDCFRSYVDENPSRSLWLIARIYFASLEKRKIKITYTPDAGDEKGYILSPLHWIYRDSSVYLAARNGGGNVRLYKLNRIKSLSVSDEHFEETTLTVRELLAFSLGAFIGGPNYTILIEYSKETEQRISEDFGRLDLTWSASPREGFGRVSFVACDLLSVCRIVFGYAGKAVIVSPKEAKAEMKRLIDENAKWYGAV